MRRRYGIIIGAAVTAACALAMPSLVYAQVDLGTLGPLPAAEQTPTIVPLSNLEFLGKQLIYDATLSDPPGYNCFTCHVSSAGGTSGSVSIVNQIAGPQPGIVPGRIGNRRPQSYAYASFSPEGPYFDGTFAMAYVGGAFWDGRVPDLSGQARQPFINPNEMNNTPTNGIFPGVVGGYSALVAMKAMTNWGQLFNQAFGAETLTNSKDADIYTLVCDAIAAYEASGELNQFSSKYDASKYGVPPQNLYTLTASEENGRQLYFGKAICNTCHSSADFPPVLARTGGKNTFSMYCFANIGVPRNYGNPFYQETDCTDNPHGCNSQGTNYVDYGLGGNPNPGLDGTVFYNTTPGDIPQFRGLFQSVTTRNVDLRPTPDFVKAYMHNGVFKSLQDVVHFYNKRNFAVDTNGNEVAFDLTVGPPSGYTPLFAPPEVIDNVQNVQGALGDIGNLGLTDQEEADIVAFMQILSDGFTAPNPVNP